MATGVLIIGALAAIVVVAALIGVVAYVASRGRPQPWRAPEEPGSHDVITLDLPAGEADDPAVVRLVREAAGRRFAAFGHIETVEVVRPDGQTLGTVQRSERLRPTSDLPASLHAEHAPRPHTPSVTGSSGPQRQPLEIDLTELKESDKAFADAFALPDAVRARLNDPGNPTAVVAAVLDVAGVTHRAEPGIVVAGDTALVLIGDGSGHTVTRDDLSSGFLRFESAGVPRGVAICLGYVNPQELHRRELLAPALKHAGPEAIQRMADALALGGNPVAFAAGAGVNWS